MTFTEKQRRNGADLGVATSNQAQPGPYGDVAAVKAQAESVGGRKDGGGSLFEWDSGLAINDVEGLGSG